MRKFKILDVQWHVGHQYEMLKFPFVEWTWLSHYKRKCYSHSLRGDLSSYLNYVTHYEPGTYDAAILHLDQECLAPAAWNNGKGVVYRDLDAVITDIPKIVIMHGSPYSPDARPPYCQPRWMVQRLQEVMGDNYLVVNSKEAARSWGWGLPIIHGMEQRQWYDLDKKPNVITTLSPGGMSAYYNRSFLADVRQSLAHLGINLCHIGVDIVPKDWAEYRTLLGQALVYFNPTKASPMPRARTEAMLSGCCVVTTPYHDASSFITNGTNGFLVNESPTQVADLIDGLLRCPTDTVLIGQAGKATAMKFFAWDRFQETWLRLLQHVVEGRDIEYQDTYQSEEVRTVAH